MQWCLSSNFYYLLYIRAYNFNQYDERCDLVSRGAKKRRCVVFAKRRIKWIRRKRIIGSKRPRNNKRLCSTFPHAKTPQRITEENWKLATRRIFSTELGQWPFNSPLCLPGKRIGFATKVFFFFYSPNWIRETLSFQWVANLDSVKAGERQWLRFCHSEDEKKASTSLVKSEWKDSAYQEIHLNLLACELELIRFYFTLTHRHTFLRKRKKERWEREREKKIYLTSVFVIVKEKPISCLS